MEPKTLDNLRKYAAFLGARIDGPLGNAISVYLPQTKDQARNDMPASFICLPMDRTLDQNVQEAYKFMKDWEEFGTLLREFKEKDRKAFIQQKLRNEPKWILRALVLIYNHQTTQEQNAEQTVVRNNVGFTGHDGKILSSFAKWHLSGKPITLKMMAVLKKSMPKYWRQVWDNSDKGKMLRLIRNSNPAKQLSLKLGE